MTTEAMPRWRRRALEMLPELTAVIAAADSPYALWFDLLHAFEQAYDRTPPDESLIKRIYRYSDWCCDQARGATAEDDLFTCVAVCFCEHISLHPKARQDMARWWRPEDLDDGPCGERNVLAYHLNEEDRDALRRFLEGERHRYDPDLRDEA